MFTLEESFIQAIKSLVQDGDKRKQYLGFILSSVVFDPALSDLDPQIEAFNKSIVNPLLQAVNSCLKRNEIFTDHVAAALKALDPIILLVYKNYDSKIH